MLSQTRSRVLLVLGMLAIGFGLPTPSGAGEIYPVCKGPGSIECEQTCVATCPDGRTCCAVRVDYLWYYRT